MEDGAFGGVGVGCAEGEQSCEGERGEGSSGGGGLLRERVGRGWDGSRRDVADGETALACESPVQLRDEFVGEDVFDFVGVAVDVVWGDVGLFDEVELPEAVGADDAGCRGLAFGSECEAGGEFVDVASADGAVRGAGVVG